MSKVSAYEVISQYEQVRSRVSKALKPMLFQLPRMIPTTDLDWTGDVRQELSTAVYGYNLNSMWASSETKISVSVDVTFGINDTERLILTFSDKYFNTWLAANS